MLCVCNTVQCVYVPSLTLSAPQTFGPSHSTVGTCLSQFATICYKQERYQQAEKLYKQSLSILEKALGKDHPKRALALHDLVRRVAL